MSGIEITLLIISYITEYIAWMMFGAAIYNWGELKTGRKTETRELRDIAIGCSIVVVLHLLTEMALLVGA